MKILSKTPVYVILYILFMLPTYFLPYLGSNSSAMIAIQSNPMQEGGGTLFFTFLHIACLAVLIAITWVRGKYFSKNWLVIFPFLAAVFDFMPGLSVIPMVPTVMHLLAIILGVVGVKAAIPATE